MKKGLCFRCGQSGHMAKDCAQSRPVIRAVDADIEDVMQPDEGKTTATEAVVKAVLAKTKKASAETETEKKDF
jgi:hypothetical protein